MARRWIPFVLVLLLLGMPAAPARAVGAFGPPVSIDDPACEFDLFNVDQAQDAAGVTHGFTTLVGTG